MLLLLGVQQSWNPQAQRDQQCCWMHLLLQLQPLNYLRQLLQAWGCVSSPPGA